VQPGEVLARVARQVEGKKTCIITGASSGLGLYTAKALVESGDWFVVMACRNVIKGEKCATDLGFPKDSYCVEELELGDLQNVRDFTTRFRRSKPSNNFQALVCNAAVYFPNAVTPTFTKDGFEESVGVTHLGHFLLANLLLEDLANAPDKVMARCIIVGSVTGNTNTVAGQVPPRANLGDMSGFKDGFVGGNKDGGAMIDGERFVGPKAYKDAKLCNMLTVREMHKRFHESTGVSFSTMYPGCIAESDLFRNHTPFFQWFFPILQKNVTKGYVTETEAGLRLADIVSNPRYTESGAYWAWKGGGDQLWDNYNNSDDRELAFNNKPSKEGRDMAKAAAMFDYSAQLVGLDKKSPLDGIGKGLDRLISKV